MNEPQTPADLSPKHVRAARALLAWSQRELAKAAGVATSTVADFERGHRTPVANNAQAMRRALEGEGVRFLVTGAVIGPPVPPFAPSGRPGAPIRWVDADDLSTWANQTDAAFSLPTLLGHLVRATHGSAVRLWFPASGGVWHQGWDGRTSVDIGSEYVPRGDAGWELSSQRSKIAQKATTVYQERTKSPEPLDPSNAAFVFVTPHHWPKKDRWIKDRQDEGIWREVRVYDATDLVHWIEQTPAVGLWLATRLGKRPEGVRELDNLWEEWSLATKWPLTEDLVLSDRDQDATEVLRWLRAKPSVLSLQATTTDEVIAFFHATLSTLPDDVAASYRARCLVATTAASARALADAPAPLILLLTEPNPGLAEALAQRGHFVLQAYDERLGSPGEVHSLARPSREAVSRALADSGIPEPKAEALARDSARNLAVLRRLIPGAPGRLPAWAKEPPPHALLAVLLVGGWDEDVEADRAQLEDIADQPYKTLIADLTPYVGNFDSPLQKIGSTWRIASPIDAWTLLAPNLTSGDITRFEVAAHAVLGAPDPRFGMDPNERWMAAVHGVRPTYSGMLRHGIGQTLILLAVWGERVRNVADVARRADAVVERLLRNADPQRWWSLSRDFRLLAEASPEAFLGAIENSLDQNDPPIRILFGADEGGIFGTEYLSDLLWGLESLAWSPALMPRVTHVLARLDAIDNPPGRNGNRPANSLRTIHLLWAPQTYATLDQRLRALDLIRKQQPEAAWKLMLGILPRGHDMYSPAPLPRWRDFPVEKIEPVTRRLIGRGAMAISDRLLTDVGMDPERWDQLLDRLYDLAPGPEAAIASLSEAEQRITEHSQRTMLWTSLRRILHRHRQFPDADWSMPDEALHLLQQIYDRFAPSDPIERTAWLFGLRVALPTPSTEGWEEEARKVDEARQEAVQALFHEGGVTSILALARQADSPGYIGKALYDSSLSAPDLDGLLEAALRSDHEGERSVAHGLVIATFEDRKEPWAAMLVANAKDEDWGETALLTILWALPVRRWTWEQAAQSGREIEDAYWRRAPVFMIEGDSEEVAYAIRKLLSVNRAYHALALAGQHKKYQISSDLLIEVLQKAVHHPVESEGGPNEVVMFQHYVAEILRVLDERNDVDIGTMVSLEWSYLAVLEHSRRPAKVLLKALSEQPDLFVKMLSAVFKPQEESGVVDPEPKDFEEARAIANQAYRVLRLWDHIPGTREDGTIDGAVLEKWIKDARKFAKAVGREEVADSRIGNMLSASPNGTDNNWPAEAVREALDMFRSHAMTEGFLVGKRNRRGVTSRQPRDGGKLEREEAAKYRYWANAIMYGYPYVAQALNSLANIYDDEARDHDQSAARLDWEI